MSNRYNLLLTALLMLAGLTRASAQDTLRTRYGVLGGYAINMHRADFRALPGVPSCCPEYQNGSGGGPVAGLLAEFPLSTWLLLSFRGSYIGHDALLSEREGVRVIVNGSGRDGAFEHNVDATISSIALEPSVGIELIDDLFLNLGLRAGTYLTKSYSQEERIVDPVDVGTFLDSNGQDSRSRVRNESAGEIPNAASMLLQGTAGFSYELPLNARGTFLLVPEVSYALSLTDVVTGLTWKPDGIRAGLALKYSPAPDPEKPLRFDTIVVRDTATRESPGIPSPRVTRVTSSATTERLEGPEVITMRTTVRESYLRELPEPPPMTCSIAAAGVDDDGNQSAVATLKIEEFLSTVAHPLLSYIFFDPNSASLPARYSLLPIRGPESFRTEALYGAGTLEIYYQMLNIIGQRMRQHGDAVLTITGCNMDFEGEKGNTELSRRRAEVVRDYLKNIWGIDDARLRVEARDLPAKRSNPTTPDGQAENRRVELTSNIPQVLDVLVADDTTRTSNPPIVRLAPAVVAPRGITGWEITISQRGSVLKRFSGDGAPPASIDWDLANDHASVPRFNEPLVINLTASSPAGERVACSMQLPTQITTIQQKRASQSGDYTIDRYNLILFNVGESGITPANQRIIDLVKSRLKPSSTLVIEGFADRSGNTAGNQRLSASRAKMTAEALGRPDATTRGIGESRLLFTNDLPEGRFYCRTVQIQVKTPVAR